MPAFAGKTRHNGIGPDATLKVATNRGLPLNQPLQTAPSRLERRCAGARNQTFLKQPLTCVRANWQVIVGESPTGSREPVAAPAFRRMAGYVRQRTDASAASLHAVLGFRQLAEAALNNNGQRHNAPQVSASAPRGLPDTIFWFALRGIFSELCRGLASSWRVLVPADALPECGIAD